MCSGKVKYLFPVPDGQVTTGFWNLRPYSKPWKERTYIHRGWDLSRSHTEKIIAPEMGKVFYQFIQRRPQTRTLSQYWPDGDWYMFSNFYYDTMGGVAVLVGQSGKIYCFGHIDVDVIFNMMRNYGIKYQWKGKQWAYNDYVKYVNTITWAHVLEPGGTIAYIGNAGYSTATHTHMQIHETRSYNSRIDPAELWPDRKIEDNGAGPEYGPRDGAEHIPSADLTLEYLRGE